MPAYAYMIVAAGTILWFVPFLPFRSLQEVPLTRDTRARWGLALKLVGYSLLWQGPFWTRRPEPWQTALAVVLFAIACALAWTGTMALGRQLRIEAALAADHELIRSGPYRFVRHPLYTSMLALFLATAVLVAPWYLFLAGLVLFLVGTEIRMRTEDALLESRFGDEFRNYRRAVRGFIPLVR